MNAITKEEIEIILDSTHDGMIAVNEAGIVTLFNKAAGRITGLEGNKIIGRPAVDVIPNTRLHIMLSEVEPELNQQQILRWTLDAARQRNRSAPRSRPQQLSCLREIVLEVLFATDRNRQLRTLDDHMPPCVQTNDCLRLVLRAPSVKPQRRRVRAASVACGIARRIKWL